MKDKPSIVSIDPAKLLRVRQRSIAQLIEAQLTGTAPKKLFDEVKAAKANSYYEQIGSVGYQPQTERLEAVVYVNHPSGYGGRLCGPGSEEYVRFFVSANNGATWDDIGLASVRVWDVPEGTEGRKRLEYAVALHHSFERWICKRPRLLEVRAILSWNVPPPAGNPNHVPVWGEIHNTHILVEPKRLLQVKDLVSIAKVGVTADLADLVDPEAILPSETRPAELATLARSYQKAGVEPGRTAFPLLAPMFAKPAALAAAPALKPALAALGIDIAKLDLGALLNPGDGNTSYEELEAIGYDPDRDELVGVIRVKKSAGYSGSTCTSGSAEHVTFWADLDGNGSFETCLGTSSVQVYDIPDLPREGLEFAVHHPAGLLKYRKPCQEGPVVVRIRAILSWAVPVPCADPNRTPVWGNREETLVHVKPGRRVSDSLTPLLMRVGEIPHDRIDGAGFIQNGIALSSGAVFNAAPFGGQIRISGKILNGTSGTRYRVMIRKHPAPGFVPLGLEPGGISLAVTSWPNTVWTTIHADADGYYAYQDYDVPNHFVQDSRLALWQTGMLEHGSTYDLRIDVKDPLNPLVDIQSNVVTVHIDNILPNVSLGFTSLPGDCAQFAENATFTGSFTATDPHFHSFGFSILPPGPANGVLPAPASGLSVHHGGAIADPGVAGGVFTLNTTGMMPCGYALVLNVWDRTNYDSGWRRFASASIGFCLGSPPQG